jgi:hypothetical protein
MKVSPPLTPILLSAAEPGSLVFYQGRLSIVTISPKDPAATRALACFDGSANKFAHTNVAQYSLGENVLRVDSEVVVEPGLDGKIEFRRAERNDTSLIFILGDDAYGVLDMYGPVFQLFSLRTGQVKPSTDNTQMAACSKWRLGIRESAEIVRWLIEV